MLQISDEVIEDIAEQQGITYSSMIGFEEFQLFYFEVFQVVDAACERKPMGLKIK